MRGSRPRPPRKDLTLSGEYRSHSKFPSRDQKIVGQTTASDEEHSGENLINLFPHFLTP